VAGKLQLDTGETVRVIERMGFNHDVGARTAWVKQDDHEFMVVYLRPGTWRRWSAADRTQPLIEHLKRAKEARSGW
jgi:hypothetical protein